MAIELLALRHHDDQRLSILGGLTDELVGDLDVLLLILAGNIVLVRARLSLFKVGIRGSLVEESVTGTSAFGSCLH